MLYPAVDYINNIAQHVKIVSLYHAISLSCDVNQVINNNRNIKATDISLENNIL